MTPEEYIDWIKSKLDRTNLTPEEKEELIKTLNERGVTLEEIDSVLYQYFT